MSDKRSHHDDDTAIQSESIIENLSASLDEALELLGDYGTGSESAKLPEGRSIAALVEQCKALCAQDDVTNEPIRTLHHFACTGGTLFSKCLAAMPNTQLLSEIDPLSAMTQNLAKPNFAPTDLIAQTLQSARGADRATVLDLFLSAVGIIRAQAVHNGHRLVIRDHSHSQFCTGQAHANRPTLLEILRNRYHTIAVLTVRDPLESYMALRERNWIHFTPHTLDEYCSRYLAFLRRYDGIPTIKYENLTDDPHATMSRMCGDLELPYVPDFVDTFDALKLTGDSGRAGAQITGRSPRTPDDDLQHEAGTSTNYRSLAGKLGYSLRT